MPVPADLALPDYYPSSAPLGEEIPHRLQVIGANDKGPLEFRRIARTATTFPTEWMQKSIHQSQIHGLIPGPVPQSPSPSRCLAATGRPSLVRIKAYSMDCSSR